VNAVFIVWKGHSSLVPKNCDDYFLNLSFYLSKLLPPIIIIGNELPSALDTKNELFLVLYTWPKNYESV
jgi:hypothetical protein